MDSHITLCPVGGLANRMKVVDSAVALWQDAGIKADIIWFQRAELNCRFSELFEDLRCEGVKIKEASLKDRILYDRPRRKNLWLPIIPQSLLFNARMYEPMATRLYREHFDFASWASTHNAYVAACERIHEPAAGSRIFASFVPIKKLRLAIERRCASFGDRTIGVHIRRTDNVAAIQHSPTCLFIERMQQEIQRDNNVRFYLATDSDSEKRTLLQTFGDRIISTTLTADRRSVAGMQEALVELYTLSHTDMIIGSAHSTFSETAAQIGGIRCEILSR